MDNGLLTTTDDTQLVLWSLVGDMAAYDELVRRYRGAVLAVAEGVLGAYEAAQDVAQEAFLLAFKALPQIEDPSKFAGWLCAIARNRARRVAARESRTRPAEPDELDALLLQESAEIAPHPVDEMIRRIEHLSVRTALGKLPEDYRIVMRLYYYEEWPVKRIGEFLSLPVTTVKWRLHQGRQQMKRHIHGIMETDCYGRK